LKTLWALLVAFFSLKRFLFQSLRDKQKTVRESQAPNMKQMKMWSVSSFFKNLTAVELNEIQQIFPLEFKHKISGSACFEMLKFVFL